MSAPYSKPGTEFQILLADSDPHDVDLVRTIFQVYWPCQISLAATRTAFEAAINQRTPDLILSASNLADFSGLAALEFASKRHPAVPFVFYTKNPSPTAKQEALARGAADYVSTDDMLGLISVIRRFCRNNVPH